MPDPQAHQLYKSTAYCQAVFSETPGLSEVAGTGWTTYQPGATPYFIPEPNVSTFVLMNVLSIFPFLPYSVNSP